MSQTITLIAIQGTYGLFIALLLFSSFRDGLESPTFWRILSFIVPFEMVGRILKLSPLIPTELSKYLLTSLGIFFLLKRGAKSRLYIVLISISILFVLFGLLNSVALQMIVFNYFGFLSIVLWAGIFRKNMHESFIYNSLRSLLFGIIIFASSVYFNSWSYADIEWTLNANFASSGGFGSNQVSTILGLGFVIGMILILSNEPVTGFGLGFDYTITCLLLIQAVLTFSRGGVITALVALLVFIFIGDRRNNKNRMGRVILIVLGCSVVLIVANRVTDGLITKRYSGETRATMMGLQEKSFNTFTTNRMVLFEEEVNLFLENPFFGLGIDGAREKRKFTDDGISASHTELSRILAEQGILGLFIIMSALYQLTKTGLFSDPIRGCLFALAILTSFHSAMRTFVTPYLIILTLQRTK